MASPPQMERKLAGLKPSGSFSSSQPSWWKTVLKATIKSSGITQGVVEGWWKCRSRNAPNEVSKLVHTISEDSKSLLLTRYVTSKSTPADDPSRGIYGPRDLLLPIIPIPTEFQRLVVCPSTPDLRDEQKNSSLKWKIGAHINPHFSLQPPIRRPLPRPSRLPTVSPLRPHILAHSRLQLWKPLTPT